MSEQQYEYYLEKRHRVVKETKWVDGKREVHPVENPEWSEWRDGSGYNKVGSVYRTLAHVKTAKTHSERSYAVRNGYVEYEFRLFRRVAPEPPPWEPVELS